ncbi:MAG: Transcriptional regulatory protein ZraR [Candidatus Latescibacteria bacterium ADurb.Bin168]|nr:MAG: Transcriptional regulatory protein ZraR [Candidatus Latescibacteria bacterium ADurb.Bin168]
MDTSFQQGLPEGFPRSVRRPGDRQEFARRVGLIGQSPAIQQVLVSIAQIAPTSTTVLITGETGTGKEIVARAIHELSPRRRDPFVALNISALNEGTVESELFGHEKGSFTDAVREKKGIFEAAGKGTVFLDEIGDISPALQVRLLRVLEEREFKRVGGIEPLHAEARVITATNRDLAELVSAGTFRADLYWRLHVFEIHLPPLRERKEDIPLLVEHFVERFCAENNRAVPVVSKEAMEYLLSYDWPGNVRELRTVVERMLVLSDVPVVRPENLPDIVRDKVSASRLLPVASRGSGAEKMELGIIYRTLLELRADMADLKQILTAPGNGVAGRSWPSTSLPPQEASSPASKPHVVDIEVSEEDTPSGETAHARTLTLRDLERDAIRQALVATKGNRREAARSLGIGERTLYRKLREYNLS